MKTGPPEWDAFAGKVEDWTREPRLQVNGYGRITIYNASTLLFEQVANANTSVVDSFIISQNRVNRSAPFPIYAPYL